MTIHNTLLDLNLKGNNLLRIGIKTKDIMYELINTMDKQKLMLIPQRWKTH